MFWKKTECLTPNSQSHRKKGCRMLGIPLPGGTAQSCVLQQSHLRMFALSLDMAATASSWVANSTSASPVTLPSGPISMCTRTGFRGEKNYIQNTKRLKCTNIAVWFHSKSFSVQEHLLSSSTVTTRTHNCSTPGLQRAAGVNSRCRCRSPSLCRADLSCGHSGQSCSGRWTSRRRICGPTFLQRRESILGLSDVFKFLFYMYWRLVTIPIRDSLPLPNLSEPKP